jgi:hypothetical protein
MKKHIPLFEEYVNESSANGKFGDKDQFNWDFDKPFKILTIQEPGHKTGKGFKELQVKGLMDSDAMKLIDRLKKEDYLSWNIIKSILQKEKFLFRIISEAEFPTYEEKEIEVDVPPAQRNYYKGMPKSTAQKKKSQISKQAEMDSDDPKAYKPLPGDKKAQSQGKVKTSGHVKKYREMFGESAINEKEEELKKGPIDNPDIEKALKKKVEETGVDLDILRVVMRRGMAAWKAGHRPGATQEQWGYARIASFVTKGPTYKTTDSDMAEVAKKRGQL